MVELKTEPIEKGIEEIKLDKAKIPLLDKLKLSFKSFFTIKDDVKRYQNNLNEIAEDIIELKTENDDLKLQLHNLVEENKRLNEWILTEKDKIE